MIIRAAALGLLLCFLAIGAFWFWGDYLLVPSRQAHLIMFAVSVPLAAALTWVSLKLIGADPGDRAEAAIGLAFPGMVLNAYVVNSFQEIFPRIDELQGQAYGALMLLAHATIILTGLMTTRISEKDEQV